MKTVFCRKRRFFRGRLVFKEKEKKSPFSVKKVGVIHIGVDKSVWKCG